MIVAQDILFLYNTGTKICFFSESVPVAVRCGGVEECEMLQDRFSNADPERLRGQLQGYPRDFFWDSITKYIAGLIVALAAIESIIEFIRGSKLTCLSSGITSNVTDTDFVNVYCESSIPRVAYFPAFLTVHAIFILIPNALWTNGYSGSFDYFFTQSRQLDRIRNYETGHFSLKNYAITKQLSKVFTNYKENQIFITYVMVLVCQFLVAILGFFIAVFYFTDFKPTFLCPSDYSKESQTPTDWPLNEQVVCAMKPLAIFSAIRLADLVLLAILILSYAWSLVWCTSSHSAVLGVKHVAAFTFQTGIPLRYYIFDTPPLRHWSCCLRAPLHFALKFVPFCGTGPHIRTNLDFLLLKLFRTDNGLGTMLRKLLIFSRIYCLNDNDHRMVKLHRMQQDRVNFRGGGELMCDFTFINNHVL